MFGERPVARTTIAQIIFLFAALASTASLAAEPQVRTREDVNARLAGRQVLTVEGIGAGQGVSRHQQHLYFYGDVGFDRPRPGVIREFTLDMKPTGREIELSRRGEPTITHPTGLTWHARWGCFLGDTVDGVANVYRIDWPRALRDGNLDRAILAHIRDDAAVNGCRPEFVELEGKTLLATADYGDREPAIRLYDVAKMLRTKRTSAPGVLVHRIDCGPFNQNLHWDADTGRLTCIQNVVAGIGWRLERFDLAEAAEHGAVEHPRVPRERLTFSPRSELEGYRRLPGGKSLFVTASRRDNVIVGQIDVAVEAR
jgi:hypothetical protein